MVDGAGVGSSECFNRAPPKTATAKEKVAFTEIKQDFRNAEMVVLDIHPYSATSGELSFFHVYGIYGNKVVSAGVREDVVTQYRVLWKEKLVLAEKKPYILNGD